MKTILLIIFLLVLFCFVVGTIYDRRKAESKRVHKEWLDDLPHDHSISSINFFEAWLIDESSESLILLQGLDQEEYDYEEIPFHRILEAALIENGRVVQAFPKNGVLANEVITTDEEGDEEEQDDMVENLSLRILIDHLADPVKEFICIEEDDYISKDSDEYEDAYDECFDWFHKLVVMIKRSEKGRTDSNSNASRNERQNFLIY